MSLKVVNELDIVYKNRCVNYINWNSPLTVIETTSKKYVQIYDTNITKQLLQSKKLAVFNYYQEGMAQLKKSGRKTTILENFWQNSLLFINNQEHKNLKVELQKEIILLENYFEENYSKISKLLESHATADCPIDLSAEITNVIIADLIAYISGLSFSICLAFIQKRKNVFFSYFHTINQSAMSENLDDFFEENYLKDIKPSLKMLICSLMLMGIDPIVSMIGAYQLEKTTQDKCFDIPSVSFITRISTDEITLFNQRYASGTIFNLSLTPNKKQYESGNFPSINFGIGAHKCLGTKLAKLIVGSAIMFLNQKALITSMKNITVTGEGTFLKFKKA